MEHLVVVVHHVSVGVRETRVGRGIRKGSAAILRRHVGKRIEQTAGERILFGAGLAFALPIVGGLGPIPIADNAGREDFLDIVAAVAQIGLPLVVLEVADAVNQILLVVFETIVVEVEIAHDLAVPFDVMGLVRDGDAATLEFVKRAARVEVGTVHAAATDYNRA